MDDIKIQPFSIEIENIDDVFIEDKMDYSTSEVDHFENFENFDDTNNVWIDQETYSNEKDDQESENEDEIEDEDEIEKPNNKIFYDERNEHKSSSGKRMKKCNDENTILNNIPLKSYKYKCEVCNKIFKIFHTLKCHPRCHQKEAHNVKHSEKNSDQYRLKRL